MTDNTFNLDELNELKQTYQLIDEKLVMELCAGQE